MGNLWTVQQSTGNLTSSGTALFRGNVQTLGQFLGDGGALDNVVYSVNSQEGALSVVGAGTVSIFTNAGTITVSGASSLTELTTISGYLQGQIDTANADVSSLNGLQDAVTIAGSDFINVNTVGQTITVSADAIVGTDGNTVISGANSVTISGFRTEFVAASGFLQAQFNNLDAIYATDAQLTAVSGHLQTQITTANADVSSLNGLQDAVTIAGSDFINITTVGQTITVLADAITGSAGNTVVSGLNSVDIVGFRPEFVSASGFLQGQITTFSDHGNLSGLADDDHLQYFRTAATSETTRIVGGNDLLFQSDGSRGTPGSVTTLSVDGATGNLDTLGTLRVRGLTGVSMFDGEVVIGDLTVTGTQTIFNSVTEVVNHLLVSGSVTIGDPDTPFEDNLTVRGDTDMILDSSRSADTVLELTHSGAAGSLDISGINNGFTWWKITNRGDATFRGLTVTGTATFTGATTGIDHGQLNGLADDDHTQYILADGTRAFTGTVQATSSGTIDIGTPAVPFDEIFGSPVVREYVAVSGSPRRGMIAIDFNNQFVGYNGSSWIILG